MAAPFYIPEGHLPIELTIPPSEKVKPEFVILKNGVEGFAERIELYKNHGYTLLKIIGDEKQRIFASSIANFLIKTYPAVYNYISTPDMINDFQKYILETYKDRYTLFGLTGKALKAKAAAEADANGATAAVYNGSESFAATNYAKQYKSVGKQVDEAYKLVMEIQEEIKTLSVESNTVKLNNTLEKCKKVIAICKDIIQKSELLGFSEYRSTAYKMASDVSPVGQHLTVILEHIKKENNARNAELAAITAKTLGQVNMSGKPMGTYAAHLRGNFSKIYNSNKNSNYENMGGGKRHTKKRSTKKRHTKKRSTRRHKKSSKKTMHKRR